MASLRKQNMRVAIIGFGRFGKTLYRLIKDDFSIILFTRHAINYRGVAFTPRTMLAKTPRELYAQVDIIFYTVPISAFESVIRRHRRYITDRHLLIDTLSVKLHPKRVLEREFHNTSIRALLTHPMFGPDSSRNGFANLPIVLDRFTSNRNEYNFWKNYFRRKGLIVLEMPADKHDRLAARSQGLTHFVGRLIAATHFQKTPLDTVGTKKLHEIVEQTCNDTWQLFLNLQQYNPYTRTVRLALGTAYNRLYNTLLPQRVKRGKIVFGIQGGVSSFNEEALLAYCAKHHINPATVVTKYLYTSAKVFNNLHRGTIDFGLFAIHNAVGGIVDESIYALASHRVHIVEEFSIIISHFLMKRRDAQKKNIHVIMAHPQVFRQCHATLARHFKQYTLKSGTGDLIDTAKAAQALAQGKLPRNYAILGPQRLAKLYDLEIIAKNLQDSKTNYTSFLMVKR